MSKAQTLAVEFRNPECGVRSAETDGPTEVQSIESELGRLFEEFREQLGHALARAASPFRDRAGATAYLHCSLGHIDNLAARGDLPPDMYDGVRPLWKVTTLEKYLEKSTAARKVKLLNGYMVKADGKKDKHITSTEARRNEQLPAVVQSARPPQGRGRDGNKPLMRNRGGHDEPAESPIGTLPATLSTEQESEPVLTT